MLHTISAFPANSTSSQKAMLSEAPTIHPTAWLRDCQIGSWTEIGPHSMLLETTVDDYSYTAGDAQIVYADIGKFCSIASHVRINPGNHPMQRVTQHHMTYRRVQYGFADSDDDEIFDWRRSQRCVIGHDVWLGHNAIILPGVHIGHGAVVGAGAVVSHDVAPYTIVVGVPARPIRTRFDPATIEQLLAIAWWDWDRPTLAARFHELNDVAVFVQRYG